MAKRSTSVVRYRTRTVRRRSGGSRGSNKLPLAVILGLIPGIKNSWTAHQQAGYGMGEYMIYSYTGLVPWRGWLFDSSGLRNGLVPLLAGVAVHYVAKATGLNRKLHIPMVEI